MTRDNTKLRAVFFAALMVLWVFAGTMAFAGSAAATDGNASMSVDNIDLNRTGPSDVNVQYTIETTITENDTAETIGAVVLNASEAQAAGLDWSAVEDTDVTVNYNGSDIGIDFVDDLGPDGVEIEFQSVQDAGDDIPIDITVADVNNPNAGGTYDMDVQYYVGDDDGTPHAASGTGQFTIEQNQSTADGELDTSEADALFAGGRTRWKGQILQFDRLDNPTGEFDSYQLRLFTPDDRNGAQYIGQLERELTFFDDRAFIRTADLTAGENYVITAIDPNTDGRRVINVTANGVEQGFIGGGVDEAENNSVEIVRQNLDTEFNQSEVTVGETVDLNILSNRNGYAVYIDSDEFTQSQLLDIVPSATDSNIDQDRAPSDEAVRVNGLASDDQIQFDFAGRSNGTYDFDFEVTDTTAADNASIEVSPVVAGDADFMGPNNVYNVKRGDIQSPEGHPDATFSLETQGLDNVTIQVGDESKNNYEAVLEVEPNETGYIHIRMNTFLAGRSNTTADEAFTTLENGGEITNATRVSGPTPGVLDRGSYDLIARETGPEDEATEFDIGVLRIQESGFESLTQLRAPVNDGPVGDLNSVSAIEGANLTETDIIAMTDRGRTASLQQTDILVYRAEISGIYGVLHAQGAPIDDGRQLLNDTNIIDLTLTQLNYEQNQNPKIEDFMDPTSNAFRFVVDEDGEQVYLVVNVRNLDLVRDTNDNGESDPGEPSEMVNVSDQFNMTVDIAPSGTDADAFIGGIDEDTPEGGNTTMLTIEDRMAEFDPQGADLVRVPNEENVTLSAETNVAPGTIVTVETRATSGTRVANEPTPEENVPIFQRDTAVVQHVADGPNTFSSDVFDFSDNEVNRTFFVSSPRNGYAADAEKEGLVVEGEIASVGIRAVTVPAGQSELASITVASATLPQGGFVTIHDGTLLDGAAIDSVRGTSSYLSSGDHSNIQISLDTPYTESGTAIAMPHQDTNGNQQYDFVSSNGQDDGAYLNEQDSAVTASASVTFATPTPTPEPPTPTPTEAPTDTPTDTPDEQPGFGAGLALVALLGAALLAARRNAF